MRALLHAAVAAFSLSTLLYAAHARSPARAPSATLVAAPTEPRPAPSTVELRRVVAARFAPTIIQETRDRGDLITAFDFDGDWDGSNNGWHVWDARYSLSAVVYYTVAETETHWFVTYVPYHPVDGKVPFGHDHDTEHVTIVVRRDPAEPGNPDLARLEAMETRFHKVLYQYAAEGSGLRSGADDIDGPVHLDERGRPSVYAQRVGHGICGGFSPPRWIDAFSLSCNHGEAPHLSKKGVVYRYRGFRGTPTSVDDRDVGYDLVEIGDTLWSHAHVSATNTTFASFFDVRGGRCGGATDGTLADSLVPCPRGIGGILAPRRGRGSTGMPWEEGSGRGVTGRGLAFLDPAFTFSYRLRFAAPYSIQYLWNPYLGFGQFNGHFEDGQPRMGPAAAPKAADPTEGESD